MAAGQAKRFAYIEDGVLVDDAGTPVDFQLPGAFLGLAANQAGMLNYTATPGNLVMRTDSTPDFLWVCIANNTPPGNILNWQKLSTHLTTVASEAAMLAVVPQFAGQYVLRSDVANGTPYFWNGSDSTNAANWIVGGGGGGGGGTLASQAEAEGGVENTKFMSSLRVAQALAYQFLSVATTNGLVAGPSSATARRQAGIVVGGALDGYGNTAPRPGLLACKAINKTLTAPANTFGATPTAANNGGFLQLQGAGAHGLSGGLGRYVHITTSSGLPSGLYPLKSVADSANNFTLDVAYQATTVTGVVRAANTGEVPAIVMILPTAFTVDGMRAVMNALTYVTNGVNDKRFNLWIQPTVAAPGASGSYSLSDVITCYMGGPAFTGGVNYYQSTGIVTANDYVNASSSIRLSGGLVECTPFSGNARPAGPQAFTPGSGPLTIILSVQFETANENVSFTQFDLEYRAGV